MRTFQLSTLLFLLLVGAVNAQDNFQENFDGEFPISSGRSVLDCHAKFAFTTFGLKLEITNTTKASILDGKGAGFANVSIRRIGKVTHTQIAVHGNPGGEDRLVIHAIVEESGSDFLLKAKPIGGGQYTGTLRLDGELYPIVCEK